MSRLSDDEFLRLEALRLAVQAGFPDFRQSFYEFLTGKSDQTPLEMIDAALGKAVADAIKRIERERAGRSFGDGA